jgi:G3E family GTPase
VLVNDFGSVNIDADLIVNVESDVVSLTNGCVCCSIREDLVDAIHATLDRPEQPEYLLLEASGVAEPSGIATTFVDNGSLAERVRLDSITCVVDAEQVFAVPDLMETKIWQIAFADMIILNKVDLVTREQIHQIRAWLDDRMHRYRMIEATYCDVPLEVLLGVGRFDPAVLDFDVADCEHVAGHRGHDDRSRADATGNARVPGYATWSYETAAPLSLEALREAVRLLPATVYRAKGIVYSADEPGRQAVLQVVGKRVDISFAGEWNGRLPRTQIVAIGSPDATDGDALIARFDQCIAAVPAT